jgi:hypothetical protein
MINDYNSLSYLDDRDKKSFFKTNTTYQKAHGFDCCKCESNRKVLGRVESQPNTTNLLFRSSKEDEL